jgi:uncharacterized membrane protein HdeD (DUF308 family)
MTEIDESWPVYLGESSRFWWMHLVRGAAALAFGVAAIFLAVPAIVLIAMLGAFALVLAAFELVEAYRLRSLRRRLLG